jgi:hypothetical protein
MGELLVGDGGLAVDDALHHFDARLHVFVEVFLVAEDVVAERAYRSIALHAHPEFLLLIVEYGWINARAAAKVVRPARPP